MTELDKIDAMNLARLANTWQKKGSAYSLLPRELACHLIAYAEEYEALEQERGGGHRGYFYAKLKAHALAYGLEYEVPNGCSAFVRNYLAHCKRSELPKIAQFVLHFVKPLKSLPG